ncbi:ESX-1 secretion-associated protein [Mycolicibacillus trivialis]
MADNIHVVPAELRAVADHHRRTAETLAEAPAAHPAIQASLDSLGPIFADLAEAGRELLEQRRRCYQRQAGAHADLADNLDAVAGLWLQHEHDAARRFDALTDGPGPTAAR